MPTRREKKPGMAELQAWFGKAIARPLPAKYDGNPLEISGPGLAGQAAKRLWTRGGLSGFDRLGIYNQQYWFRLITIMQQEYPCAAHLMGLGRFNGWAVRYLEAHPPASPYLTFLDAAFPSFLEKKYRDKNRRQVLQAVAYERAFSKAVDAPAGEPVASGAGAGILSLPLRLAPHATPVRMDWDFTAYRALCLEDESLEKRIALRRGAACVLVYRDATHAMRQAPLDPAACRVLSEMREPSTVPEIFARLEGKLNKAERTALEKNLTAWFRDWVATGWVCLAESPDQKAMPTPQRLRKDSR